MNEIHTGLMGIALLFLLLMSSMPVGFAMTIVGVVGFAVVVNPTAALAILASDYYETFSNYGLTVIPLFIFMGQIAFHTGISKKLFDAANGWFGWLRGGLAMSTVGACTAFSAICGSGPATAATMAAVALPEMKRHKYHPGFAAGTVAAGGSIGMMIPPSVVFIVYGIMTEQSIGKIFMAGILPGLLVALLFMGTIWLLCRWNPVLAPACAAVTWRERFRSLKGVVEILLLFLLVMGGMFAGWFTPTEAAAVGAAGSLLLAAVLRKLTGRMLFTALSETLRTTCMVMVIVAGATVFGHFLQITNVPMEAAAWLSGLPLPPMGIMVMILLFYIVAGAFLDALALMLLTIPIFYPVILKLGFDPIWFGVMVVLLTQIGVISPPVGVNVYVVSGMDRSIPLQSVFKGALPFLVAMLVAAVLLLVFPQLATAPTTWVK
ncbi:MAG: TRAP transporter large permease [Verrucomicrobiota bacterium]|jgi:tripartite ATP-independent transporter DctM subunit|nr:TRAP transporter large permease [Verrucomicrobiota bacterium]